MATLLYNWNKSGKTEETTYEIEIGWWYANGKSGKKKYTVTKSKTVDKIGKPLKVITMSHTKHDILKDAMKKVKSLKTGKGWRRLGGR